MDGAIIGTTNDYIAGGPSLYDDVSVREGIQSETECLARSIVIIFVYGRELNVH